MFGNIQHKLEEHLRNTLIDKLARVGELHARGIGTFKWDDANQRVILISDDDLNHDVVYRKRTYTDYHKDLAHGGA